MSTVRKLYGKDLPELADTVRQLEHCLEGEKSLRNKHYLYATLAKITDEMITIHDDWGIGDDRI
jgi:hypothetical protein